MGFSLGHIMPSATSYFFDVHYGTWPNATCSQLPFFHLGGYNLYTMHAHTLFLSPSLILVSLSCFQVHFHPTPHPPSIYAVSTCTSLPLSHLTPFEVWDNLKSNKSVSLSLSRTHACTHTQTHTHLLWAAEGKQKQAQVRLQPLIRHQHSRVTALHDVRNDFGFDPSKPLYVIWKDLQYLWQHNVYSEHLHTLAHRGMKICKRSEDQWNWKQNNHTSTLKLLTPIFCGCIHPNGLQ